MNGCLEKNGFLELTEIRENCGYPTEERFLRGPVAVAECIQRIPCNPCEAACRYNAITIGKPITNLPNIDFEKCIGCGACIPHCSGLAIFVINKTAGDNEALVSFPHEYLPLPEVGTTVEAVNRHGEAVCQGRVVRVSNSKKNDRTVVITIAIPRGFSDEVRGMKRLGIKD